MTYDDSWKCRFCGELFVVPSLARDHEERCFCNADAVA